MTGQIVPWRQQLQNSWQASQQRHSRSHAQLSTIRGPSSGSLHGRPACRTVNIRAFHQNKFYFVSDLRSGKANDIQEGPSNFAEICWYFPETKTQFRISGRLNFHSDDAISTDTWASLTDAERKWWTWPSPGEQRASACDFVTIVPDAAPSHFCVCRLDADFVDLLHLEHAPFMREKHVLKKGGDDAQGDKQEVWTAMMVNP